MRLVSFFVIPITAVLFVAGIGIAVLLFGYGAATTEQAELLGFVISIFMLGLVPFTLFYVLLRGYYALEDTRTPFIITVIFSIILLVILVPLFSSVEGGGTQIAFIALCYSISYWVGLIIAWIVLARKVKGMESGKTLWSITRMFIAGVVAVMIMLLVTQLFNNLFIGVGGNIDYSDKGTVLIRLMLVSFIGIISYLLTAWILRVREIKVAQCVIAQKMNHRVHT
jgi:putative peptidoglycan lipid II flippase